MRKRKISNDRDSHSPASDCPYYKVRNSVIRLLKFRPRSEAEIRERLTLKQYAPRLIEQVIGEFRDCGLIDDADFARKWVSYRKATVYGPLRIQRELIQKGVDPDIIAAALGQDSEEYDERAAAQKAAERRMERYKDIDSDAARKRLFDFLLRRGFKTNTAYSVIKEFFK